MDSTDMTPPSASPSDGLSSEPQATMVERGAVGAQVPNLLRVSPMDTMTATDVETSITDPVVRSDSFVRFTLLNKGILHSHSKITLEVVPPDGGNRYFPLTTGVHSLISRAALKVGTKTLQEIDGYNYLSAYKQMFVSNEHQLEREQVLSGKVIAHEFRYSDADTPTGGPDNDTRAFTYGLSNGKEYNTSYQLGGADPNLDVNEFVNIVNKPQFQIALSDLFPMLKQTQLPLYMMQEQVSIELTFEPNQEARANAKDGIGLGTYVVNTDEVKFIADYIYYPQEMMATYANQNPEITINHFDYRHSKVSISATSTSGTTQIRNLGGAGRIVTKVITGLQADQSVGGTITNQYHSISPEAHYQFGEAPGAGDDNGSLTANIKYNDRFLYPIDVTNQARHFHNTAQSEGMVPFVTREEFSAEGVALTSDDFMGRQQNTGDGGDEVGVLGRFNWLSFRLNRNERINSRGLEYYWKYAGLDNDGGLYTQRSWIELAKISVLQAGFMTTQLL